MAGTEVVVLLTDADVHRWRDEKADLERQIRDAQERISTLSRKLDAAAVFMQTDEGAPDAAQEGGVPVSAEETGPGPLGVRMTNHVVRVLEETKAPMTPSDIRAALEAAGFRDQIRGNPNYLYTLLSRLSARGRIAKEGDGYRAARSASPEGETGGVAPPASSQPT